MEKVLLPRGQIVGPDLYLNWVSQKCPYENLCLETASWWRIPSMQNVNPSNCRSDPCANSDRSSTKEIPFSLNYNTWPLNLYNGLSWRSCFKFYGKVHSIVRARCQWCRSHKCFVHSQLFSGVRPRGSKIFSCFMLISIELEFYHAHRY